MYLSKLIKQAREQQGLTQNELAYAAQVSLPSVQNIESGRNPNPSLNTLTTILSALGLTLVPQAEPVRWDVLSACGAPLMVSRAKHVRPNALLLLKSLRAACLELDARPNEMHRERLAVQSLLLALSTHYPNFFKQHCRSSPLLMKHAPLSLSGPMIKLKRQAAAVLAEYL